MSQAHASAAIQSPVPSPIDFHVTSQLARVPILKI